MDAPCKIQRNIHVLLYLNLKSMCPGNWVHINMSSFFIYSIFLKKIDDPDHSQDEERFLILGKSNKANLLIFR